MDNKSREHVARARIHSGLPRQGPGSDKNTEETVRRLPSLPDAARIYDLGCGPGRASIILARILRQKIICVDLQQSFLDQLNDDAAKRKLEHLIETRCGDMSVLPDKKGSIDLIWAEGAIYAIGFDAGLRSWHPLLSERGMVACSELSWLVPNPSEEPIAYWKANYPGIRSVAQNVMAAEQLGYECIDHFTLPESCWWDEYYNPWSRNLEDLREDAKHDEVLRAVIERASVEIDLFRRFSNEYGYEFYLLRKSDIKIRLAVSDDAPQIAQLMAKSLREALPFLPIIHTAEDDLMHISTMVLPNNEVFVAHNEREQIVGFIAFDDEWVHTLYLLPEFMSRGIGTRLLNIAKVQRKRLMLWTFQKNEIAKLFYAKHGFVVTKETDGASNEERQPDVHFEWIAPI